MKNESDRTPEMAWGDNDAPSALQAPSPVDWGADDDVPSALDILDSVPVGWAAADDVPRALYILDSTED
ncbi:hypothetical protein [Streptomyces sp. NPDC051569]|jgi:hypothetical protein|uniref:hypothetical protein n=1 Tax=Streptomyces sp. NPDC051569 TaxID=3365661 RepID=UPI0037AA532C